MVVVALWQNSFAEMGGFLMAENCIKWVFWRN
jgi:hypothetical protein